MIARTWSARIARDQAQRYAEYFERYIIPELRVIDGYESAIVMQRPSERGGAADAGVLDLQVVTLWRSIDAIRAFAGEDVEAAVVTELAASMLLDYDRRVRHHDVVVRHA